MHHWISPLSPSAFRCTRFGSHFWIVLLGCLITGWAPRTFGAVDIEGQIVLATTARTPLTFGRIEVRVADGSIVSVAFVVAYGAPVNPMRMDTAQRMIQFASVPGQQVRLTRLYCPQPTTTQCLADDRSVLEIRGAAIPITVNGVPATLLAVCMTDTQSEFADIRVSSEELPLGYARISILRRASGPPGLRPLSDAEFDRALAILAQAWTGSTPTLQLTGIAAGFSTGLMHYHHGSALYANRP